jgi:glycosyltransferase involved in cell wall biosynthesis
MQVSVTMITKNEEQGIHASLESVQWAYEVIVVDSGSTDRTVEIARRFTTKVIHHDFVDFATQKNYASSEATANWILNLDADELCSPELAREIANLPEEGPSGYWILRRNQFQGRWIRHCGWFPDYKLRLYRRGTGEWRGKVHESLELVKGSPVIKLKGTIEHYTYRNFDRYLQSTHQFSRLAARQMYEYGRSAGILDLIFRPPAAFLKKYILQMGFLDRVPGFIISVMTAYGIFLRYSYLREMRSGDTNPPGVSARIDESDPH